LVEPLLEEVIFAKEIDVNNLTIDENATIKTHTMESKTEQAKVIVNVMNSTLRLVDRYELKPILFYLRLLLEFLAKFLSSKDLVYRNVNDNISNNFIKNKILT
jgi:hypothetical protein